MSYKGKTKTTVEFIEEAILKHGDRFDYSRVVYVNNKSKLLIGCKIHGFFLQRASPHLFGYGCHSCLKENRNPYRGKELDYQNKFVENSRKLHNDKYDYSLCEYERSIRKMKIICPEHGIFLQTAYEHSIRGSGCPKCVGKFISNQEFIEKCRNVHNNKYDYSLCDYKKSSSLIRIICPKHGEFSQKACYHLNGCGCYKCKESYGEKRIGEILDRNNVKYETQKRFDGCAYKYKLAFDFYLTELNVCIEYNGIQHYEPMKFFGGQTAFDARVERDNLKVMFCKENNIKLLIIRYDEDIMKTLFDHIEFINT